MKPILQTRYDTFLRELHQFRSEENGLQQAKKSVEAGIQVMKNLREYISVNPLKTPAEEIIFFKEVKPVFLCQLVYWNKVLRYELNKPVGAHSDRENYILNELQRLKHFFDDNIDFYRYYRSGTSHLDAQYFSRGNNASQLSIDLNFLNADPQFSTSHDYKLSKLLGYEMFNNYLNSELEIFTNPRQAYSSLTTDDSSINWTASHTGLIELMYACKSYGTFNNGKATINQIADFFEKMFQTKLGNYYRTFQEIRIRKKGRTFFLDQLREKLIQRMDDADENPR